MCKFQSEKSGLQWFNVSTSVIQALGERTTQNTIVAAYDYSGDISRLAIFYDQASLYFHRMLS